MSLTKQDFKELAAGQELTSAFGNFKVIDCIAMGRCCEVYQGEQVTRKRPVALKVFRRHQDYGGALQRELFFLRKLSAQGAPVVEHLGEVQWEGRDILVQELLTCTLRDIFLSLDDGSCSAWLVLTIATNILRGLAHLHKNGIVHADLKPMNLLWDAKTSTFKIIDFGLSFKASEEYTHIIQSKGYQAPECLRWNALTPAQRCHSQERPSSSADVWSAGCIIIEAMTGSQFVSQWCSGGDAVESVKVLLASTSFAFSGPFVAEAQSFLTRCLQISPSKRPSAQELLDDPWLMQYHQPSFSDMSLLPTTVIRIMNLEDPRKDNCRSEVVLEMLSMCQKYGKVKDHHSETSLGYLYVLYEESSEAEVAQQSLTEKIVNDRMVIVSFYPLTLWMNNDFF